MVPAVPSSTPFNSPLEDTCVLSTQREEVTVTVGKADVRHVTAMTVILVAWCLKINQKHCHVRQMTNPFKFRHTTNTYRSILFSVLYFRLSYLD